MTIAGAVVLAACGAQRRLRRSRPRQATPACSENEVRELDIEYFAERARRDPTGRAISRDLGALYLARARETGDPRDVLLAEQVARRSLENRPQRNGAAAQVLQSSLLAQHRFDEALTLASGARTRTPRIQRCAPRSARSRWSSANTTPRA